MSRSIVPSRSIVRFDRTLALAVIALGLTLGCRSAHEDKPLNSELTQGNVQMHLVKGQTTKAQVLEVFGAPNPVSYTHLTLPTILRV